MSVSLPPASVERYAHDGILFPIPVLSTTEVTEYRHALESVAAMCGEGYRRRFDNLHLFFPWAYRLATKEGVLMPLKVFSVRTLCLMLRWSFTNRRMIPVTRRGTRTVFTQIGT